MHGTVSGCVFHGKLYDGLSDAFAFGENAEAKGFYGTALLWGVSRKCSHLFGGNSSDSICCFEVFSSVHTGWSCNDHNRTWNSSGKRTGESVDISPYWRNLSWRCDGAAPTVFADGKPVLSVGGT